MSSSRTRLSKKACIWCCEAGSERSGIANGKVAAGRELEPFVADQQHRLRQVERGKAGIDREGDDPVGERDLLVLQAVALAAEQDAGPAAGCRHAPRSRRAASAGATTGLAWSWARAVVANSSVRSATACSTVSNNSACSRMWSAPAAARWAATFGQPSRGLTILKRRQREIAHRARGHADILAELRLDQDHNGSGEVQTRLGFIGARTGHSHFTF